MDSKTSAIDYGEGCLMALLSSPVCDIRNWEDDVKKKTNRRQIWKANGDLVEHNSNLFTKNTGFVQADLVTFRTSGKPTYICQKCWNYSEKPKICGLMW